MRVRLLLAVFVAVLLAPIADATEKVEFMSVVEVRQLLAKGPVKATFNTVAEGSKLAEYEIELRGTIDLGDVTIVMFTSPNFIVAGMSGSPVYVKGSDGHRKLLGALAYNFARFVTGPQWGGVSPIEYMHAEAQGASRPEPQTASTNSFTYEGKTFAPISVRPVAGSVIASAAANPWVLAPGMPISVDLLEWTDQSDTSKTDGSTGTITYISEAGDIYAFGHPFLGARTARYNFHTCRIMGTVYSESGSFKLPGEQSPVLGTIEYDGAYGIYGKIGGNEQRPVTSFTADFASNGKPTGTYRVKVATSPYTSTIMSMALEVIGSAVKAPFAAQPSTVAFASTIELEGHEPVQFSQVFTSTQFQFGPMVVRNSSYENASEAFLQNIYVPISTHRMGFKITGTHLSFDFTAGIAPSLKIASVKFPTVIKYGENPVMELLLVSEDNSVSLSKRTVVQIDWTKVEQPTYTADTKDTDKQSEKVVRGSLAVYSAAFFGLYLGDNEKELENPAYFLNPKDYLANFRKDLGRSNRMLYARVSARRRSGLDNTSEAAAEQTAVVGEETADWVRSDQGLTERKVTIQKETVSWFTANLPPVPAGYMVATASKVLSFEIVN